VINFCLMMGGRYFGLAGALAALAGMLAAPTVVLLVLALAFGIWQCF
jgi:chromate transporter